MSDCHISLGEVEDGCSCCYCLTLINVPELNSRWRQSQVVVCFKNQLPNCPSD